MIKLKNVSKFYYSKGVIASGFTKVSLEFKMGEFVAITGESGSGKSTLLNVISGLDSYEEGEMYIHGEETSHYTEKDFEDYRRKYIGNIFQNFNLINSYTVYQNIELVLLLNGGQKKDIKHQVLELIKKVGLYQFKNTKVSKLSGGQKQRVAIARALAKDTPIIIADEPTGNLDTNSAKGIISLLSEVAKDKLVIVVTHNEEQVEKHITRKIKMHDGKVLEDKKIKEVVQKEETLKANYGTITLWNKIRLAIRNTFNIIPKFMLLFAVYLFITVAIISEYASFKEQEYIASKSGFNYVFSNVSDKRIIITKKDRTSFSEEEYQKIETISNVDSLVKNDLLLDTQISLLDNENFWINGTVNNLKNFKDGVDVGTMPTAENEIIIEGNKNDYYIGTQAEQLLNKELYSQNYMTGEINYNMKVKVVGINYIDTNNVNDYQHKIYMSDNILKTYLFQINQSYSDIKILFMDKYYASSIYDVNFKVEPNATIPEGHVFIPSDLNYLCPKQDCITQPLTIEVNNLYYNEVLNLTVSKSYQKTTFKELVGLTDFENNNGVIFISPNDYNRLFDKDYYQSSVFVKDVNSIDQVVEELHKMDYNTLEIKDALVNFGTAEVLKIMRTVVTVVLVVALFFISYFVIRIILKSRNVYFSTIRMLGATKKISKQLLVFELLLVSNLAYFLFLGMIYMNHLGIINITFMHKVLTYLLIKDYILLYTILTIMSYLISQKFAKKLFKNSVISTIQEEV